MPPSTAELRASLERVLAEKLAPGLPIVALERQMSEYRSSFPLEELQVALANGDTLNIIFKDLNRSSLAEDIRRVKPQFLDDPLREIEAYRLVLSTRCLGTARCYGADVDHAAGRYWLFLEHVRGRELYQVGELSTWQAVARWLARLHRQSDECSSLTKTDDTRWINYDAEYFRLWIRRAVELSRRTGSTVSAYHRDGLASLAARYDRLVDRLTALPPTFIHGEFYASNILVEDSGDELRICPIDWEMAAYGPGLIDLAALVSGRWTDAERSLLIAAYSSVLIDEWGADTPADSSFLDAIDDCRLHLAVQWLGWAEHWTAPPEHAHDWLGEALTLAEKVGCL